MGKIIEAGLKLFLICAIAAALLGWVFSATLDPIKAQKDKKTKEAQTKVLPEADNFVDVSKSFTLPDGVLSCYEGNKDGQKVGYVIEVNSIGYSSVINTLVGIDSTGTIKGIDFLSIVETPGLGMNALKPSFMSQYIGKTGPLSVVKASPSDQEIEAMTSSTITTNAVTLGVNHAVNFYNNNLKGGN